MPLESAIAIERLSHRYGERQALDSVSFTVNSGEIFGILFLWQMPHFLAIAWLCRADYASAGLPMLTVHDPEGTRTARQVLLYGAALVPISLLPAVQGLLGVPYFLGALVLGLAYLGFGVDFARRRSTPAARRLMLASILYLPALLAVMLVDGLA